MSHTTLDEKIQQGSREAMVEANRRITEHAASYKAPKRAPQNTTFSREFGSNLAAGLRKMSVGESKANTPTKTEGPANPPTSEGALPYPDQAWRDAHKARHVGDKARDERIKAHLRERGIKIDEDYYREKREKEEQRAKEEGQKRKEKDEDEDDENVKEWERDEEGVPTTRDEITIGTEGKAPLDSKLLKGLIDPITGNVTDRWDAEFTSKPTTQWWHAFLACALRPTRVVQDRGDYGSTNGVGAKEAP